MGARNTAWQILCDICLKEQYGNLSLRKLKEQYEERDQAFINTMVYGTLQHNRYVRYQWQCYVKKLPDPELSILLDMSTYQLLFLDTPSYAVINEAGNLAKNFKNGYAVNFINAILHEVERNGARTVTAENATIELAIQTSHPTWLIQLWIAHYGLERCKEIASYDQTTAPLTLRVNTLKISREELLKQEERFTALTAPQAVQFEGNIIREHWFKEGYVFPQDENSQSVAAFSEVAPNMRVLDFCAAPGTKTIQMAAIMENKGEIIACDLYAHRTALIAEAMEKAGATMIQPVTLDAREISQQYEPASFDLVVVDAPCSGLGVLRHKPDIKLRVTPKSLDEIMQLQEELLTSASNMVKPGGLLVYSTCTLNKKENEKQAEHFTSQHTEYQFITEHTAFPSATADGFYMAKWRRIE